MMRRDTSQQRAIRAAIDSAGRPLSVQEIHVTAAKESPSLGLRTVYRVVNRMLGDGAIAPVVVPGQPDRYEPAAVAEKHHHRCEQCDRIFDVDAFPGGLSRMLPPGFKLTGTSSRSGDAASIVLARSFLTLPVYTGVPQAPKASARAEAFEPVNRGDWIRTSDLLTPSQTR